MFTVPVLYYIWSINATLLHGAGNRFCETFCKDAGYDFLFGWMLYHAGDCFCGSELRFGRDFGDFFVECAAENAGKCECVVDLIGKIRASRSNNASAKTIASADIVLIISGVIVPGPDTPTRTSTPAIAPPSVASFSGFVVFASSFL